MTNNKNKINLKYVSPDLKRFMENKPIIKSITIKEDPASLGYIYETGDKLGYDGCNYIIAKKEFYKDHSVTYFVKKEVIK